MQIIRTNIRTNSGIAIGRAWVVERTDDTQVITPTGSPQTESELFTNAIGKAKSELKSMAASEPIFEAHLEMADDPELLERVSEKILAGQSAIASLRESRDEIVEMFMSIDDEYLRERATDVRDVCGRIERILSGANHCNPFADIPAESVVVAHELTPSDTAQMDLRNIVGFATATGSSTSHVCIIGRNHGITSAVGLGESISEIHNGDRIIIDSTEGVIYVCSDDATTDKYTQIAQTARESDTLAKQEAHRPATTLDGIHIHVYANVGNNDEVRNAIDSGADGIGLYRSELLYMSSDTFPDEETQFASYAEAATICGDRPLTIRTLDIGGDKALPYMPISDEDNPFLGWRAIRISLKRVDLFKTQLRALLRAAAHGNLRIMLPMICTTDELRSARKVIDECIAELRAENLEHNPHTPIGIMIETPAAVMIADLLATECDFFSIGTNDLTQYIMAADRGNPMVSALNDPRSTPVMRAIHHTIDVAARHGIEVGMCGEFASDPSATQMLLASGLPEFSVSINQIGALKARIRTL